MKVKLLRIIIVVCLFAAMLGFAMAESTMVVLPWELQTVHEQAFMGADNIAEVILPDDTARIEKQAFANSGLKLITLPSKIAYIAEDAFEGCENLVAECEEGTYAYEYCKRKGITVTEPSLVVRVLQTIDTQKHWVTISTTLDSALDELAAGHDMRIRAFHRYDQNAAAQAASLADTVRMGADLVLIDLADASYAAGFAENLSDAGIPFMFFNAEPSADVVTAHDSIFVGCSNGLRAYADDLAQVSAEIAVNYLSTGKWIDGLDYASADGWSVRLKAANRLSGVKIGIDPGHQRKGNSEKEYVSPTSTEKKAKVSSGTSGVATRTAEYIRVLEISLLLRDCLEELGAEVYMTRETHDVNISNMERAIMMNNLGVDLVLRIHCNGSSNQSVHGIGLYITKSAAITAESLKAAQAILPAMVAATGARSSGIYQRDSYTGLNWSTVPCILVETGYMTNPTEDLLLADPAYQQKLVDGMIEGICKYMGIE